MAEQLNDYGIAHRPEVYQEVLNQSCPPADVARTFRDDMFDGIPVSVRVVFDGDGETHLDGTATRWHGRHVFVRFADERSRLGFARVDAGDVRRR